MGLTMKEKKSVAREYARRYKKVKRKQKTRLLDEFVKLTGYRRDYASFILSHWGKRVYFSSGRSVLVSDFTSMSHHSGRKKKYDIRVFEVLVKLWELMNNPCGKRLKAALSDLMEKAAKFNELKIEKEVVSKLLGISSATIDRLLQPERKRYQLKAKSKTKPGSLLKSHIPIRTGMDWDENEVGFLEIDLVSHDGGNARGEFCYTLNAVDVKTGWTDFEVVKNRAQIWVFEALKNIRARLPFELRGIDSDNGSEFINDHLFKYCHENGIMFTRSRPSHKNDNCHVEEKNYTAIRSYVSYYRYDTNEQRDVMNKLYSYLRLYFNFFQPQMKLKEKVRVNSKITKKYYSPQTPYKRLITCEDIEKEIKDKLSKQYDELNPFQLKRTINRLQKDLFTLAYIKRREIS